MALLRGDMEHFSRVMADVNASDSDTIHELLTVAESAAWNDTAHVDGQTMVHVVTVIGDIASVGLSEDEVKSYQTPRGTVLQIVAPSSERWSSGFVLGPFTVPAFDDVKFHNASVQVISWAENVFDMKDISQTMLTLTVRKNMENVPLTNLTPPLHFRLEVRERMAQSGTDDFGRTCVFWNSTAGNWSDRGLEVVRTNLTQVSCESTHATSFAVKYVAVACPFCNPPVSFFQLEAKMSASCWTLLVLVVSVCIYGVRLHAQDRRDWIPPRNNVEAYFPPPRSVKKNKSLLAALRRILVHQLKKYCEPV